MCALRGDIFPAPLLVKVLDDEALDGRKWVYYPSDVEKLCEDEVAAEEFDRLFAPKVKAWQSKKTITSDYGECEISVHRDRKGEFEPKVIEKRQTHTDEIEQKILAMYEKECPSVTLKIPSKRSMALKYLKDLFHE